MRNRVSKAAAVVVIGVGMSVGWLAGPSWAAGPDDCPPGTEWDPIGKVCIPIDPDGG